MNNINKHYSPDEFSSSRSYNGANYDPKNDTLVYALGGLGEVGKNMYCFEHDDEIIVIDAGVKFPDDELLGVDYVIPDYTHLIKNKEKVKALIITHGHEDHIGGIPFLLLACPIKKIYAPRFAKALIEKKLSERRRLANTQVIEIDGDSAIQTDHFRIGFFNTVHSIPDSLGVLINTPNGRIVETGDFKFDLTPVGQNSDYQKMAYIGAAGVTLLMSDSTNAEVDGFSISEKQVASAINDIMRKTSGRILISTFASNVNRLAQIIKAAKKCDRKVVVFGRSMENVVEIGLQMKTIDVPDDTFLPPEMVNSYPPEKLCIICT
ncbi:MAG: ribonuclease J, partial [Erysipelotrichaceae bacterium]|nr:ribonuclease J [Erysipelotrichaceae bacterium]